MVKDHDRTDFSTVLGRCSPLGLDIASFLNIASLDDSFLTSAVIRVSRLIAFKDDSG